MPSLAGTRTELSKFLSFVLRHRPEAIGLELDPNGWADIDDLAGTIAASLAAIRTGGLQRMERHHVRLSPDVETARVVGMRRGRPVVLRVAAGRMHRDGHVFFLSANGVWLTEHVPPVYIDLPG